MTWGGGGASDKLVFQRMKLTLESKGQQLLADYFVCLGKTLGFARKGRPNEGDLVNARKWAAKQANNYEKSMQNLFLQ